MTSTEKEMLVLRRNVDDSCLIAFGSPDGWRHEQQGDRGYSQGRRQSLEESRRSPESLIEPADDVAILSHEASATRANGEPPAALVSTGYFKRDDGWEMVFHQQMPLSQDGSAAR